MISFQRDPAAKGFFRFENELSDIAIPWKKVSLP